MRYVWSLAVLLLLPGCATKSTPVSASRTFEWPEWSPTPLPLLGAPETQPVWYSVANPNARDGPARFAQPAAIAKPIPVPAARRPEPGRRRGNVETVQVAAGKKLKLEASADGSPPFFFQWNKAGRPMPGAVHPLLTFEPVKAEDAGEYACVVSNAYGALESHPVRLIVRAP